MARADIMAGRAYVSLYVKKDEFAKSLDSARKQINQFGSDILSLGTRMAGFGGALLSPIAASLKIAGQFEEAISKFGFVFKGAAKSTQQWGDEFAKQVGRSRLQIVEFLADSQALMMPMGFDESATVDMSKRLTELAIDLASFNNKADSDVLRDLHSALVGSSETMLKYGVIANETAVKQELLNQSIDPSKATNQQKVMARYNIILRGTAAAHGDATRTSQSLTNMLKSLRGTLSDAAVEIGTAIIPAVAKLTSELVAVIRPITEMIRKNPELIMSFTMVSASVVGTGIAIMGLGVAAKVAAAGIAAASIVYQVAAIAVRTAWASVALVFGVLTLKGKITAAIVSSAWTVAGQTISTVFKTLATVLTSALSVGVLVASSAIVATAWVGAAGLISVAIFGLGAVMTTASGIATAAWTAAGGVVTAVWVSASATIASAWAASSAIVSMLAGVAIGAWVGGAGVMGTAMAVLGALFASTGGTGTTAATITGAAWSAAGAISAAAWSGFTAILGAVFAEASVLTVAAFAVKTAWAAAWMAVSGPILPIIALASAAAAGLAAIGSYLVYVTLKSLDFSAAMAVAKQTLLELLKVAKRVGGILMRALGGGDYDLAFRAAIAGLKIALAESLEGLWALWKMFWEGIWELTKSFFSNVITLTWNVVKAIANAMRDPISAAQNSAAAIATALSGPFEMSIGIDTEGMKKSAIAELDAIEAELKKREAKREAETKAKEEEAKQKAMEDAGLAGADAAQPVDPQAAMDAAKAEMEASQKKIAEDAKTAELERRAQQLRDEQMRAEQEASRRVVSRIQDFADAAYESKGVDSDEVALREKRAIAYRAKIGEIDAATAKEAMLQADIRKDERKHQKDLKKFRGEDDKKDKDKDEEQLKSGGTSAATFSARSLMSMGSGAGETRQYKAIMSTKKAIEQQTLAQAKQSDVQIRQMRRYQLKHGG